MSAGRNIGGGPGGRPSLPEANEFYVISQGYLHIYKDLEIIISLSKKLHGILSFRKLYK